MTARRFVLAAAACAALLLPAPGSAQTPAATPGPLRIEPLDSGFIVTPEARFGDINGDFATFAGAHAGWVTDHKLLIGGAGYWLANRDDDFKMQYFGGLARWTLGSQRPLGVSFGALAGFGDATMGRPYGDLFGTRGGALPSRDGHRDVGGRFGSPINSAAVVRVSDSFFIAEPQIDALWRITSWMRLDAGVGYRVIGGAELLGDQLRGVSGSIGVRFGGH
jgi:hypothetical protein